MIVPKLFSLGLSRQIFRRWLRRKQFGRKPQSGINSASDDRKSRDNKQNHNKRSRAAILRKRRMRNLRNSLIHTNLRLNHRRSLRNRRRRRHNGNGGIWNCASTCHACGGYRDRQRDDS